MSDRDEATDRELYDLRAENKRLKERLVRYQNFTSDVLTDSERLTEEAQRLNSERKATQNDSRVITCAFCGHEYPPGTPTSNNEALVKHVRVCTKHPIGLENRGLETEIEKLSAENLELMNSQEWAIGEMNTAHKAKKELEIEVERLKGYEKFEVFVDMINENRELRYKYKALKASIDQTTLEQDTIAEFIKEAHEALRRENTTLRDNLELAFRWWGTQNVIGPEGNAAFNKVRVFLEPIGKKDSPQSSET